MHTIVSLGNPTDEYENTRHNAGRIVLSNVLKAWGQEDLTLGRPSNISVAGKPVTVLNPDTYMNESGKAIRRLIDSDEAKDLIVIYDEIDLPLGQFKVSKNRGDGGHNGLSSIIASLDTKDFTRIRVGIAKKTFFGRIIRPEGEKLSSYVLGRLSRREKEALEGLTEPVKEAIEMIVKDGADRAMNRFN